MTDVLIVSEDQAVALEKVGIKVEIQYIVKLADMVRLNQTQTQVAKPLHVPTRTIRYGRDAALRWTGLKWTGRKGTQPHVAYEALAAYFKANPKAAALKRSGINRYLTKEFMAKGIPFNSSVVTHLCNQKYLEPLT